MKRNRNWFWMILPALLLILIVFGGSLIFTLAESVGFFAPGGSLTFAYFTATVFDREVVAAFFLTLILASAATVTAAVAGTALAIFLRGQIKRSPLLKIFLQIPLAIPHLAAALLLLNLLAPSGILARIFFAFGAINAPADFPVLTGDAYGIGIVLAYVLKETPFVALLVLTILTRVGDEFEQIAQTLGASAWQRFRFVVLPLIAPAVVFSSLVVWVFTFGAFEIPYILGRAYPAMLAIVTERKFRATDLQERPEAFALAIIMTAITVVFVRLYIRRAKNFVGFEKTSIF